MVRYFDTHAHYDDEKFDEDRDELLGSLPGKGVEKIVVPGCSISSSCMAVELSRRYDYVYAAIGIHPHDAANMKETDIEKMRSLARDKKVVAIGEIGLDYHYDFSPRETQKVVMRTQMQLARELGLPVIIHDREAHADCFNIVKEFSDVTGVYHCYSGSWEQAKEILKLGWYISFTGSVTFRNAYRVPEVAAKMPFDRMMIETDAPYMTPVPHRGKRNDSSYLPFICEKIAAERCITPEEVAEQTYLNGLRFFGIEG